MPVTVRICETSPEALAKYAMIPIRFRITSRLCIPEGVPALERVQLVEKPVGAPIEKDYDSLEGEGPRGWPHRFDMKNWGLFIAEDADRPVGGATVIDAPDARMLGGEKKEVAVLWDIRVHPDRRGEGIGTRLFERACEWARAQGAKRLRIETQDTNVNACRFYAGRGCRLDRALQYVYPPPFDNEVMLIWTLDL